MTDSTREPESLEEAHLQQRLRLEQEIDTAEPSPAHDVAILEAARAAGSQIARRDTVPARVPWRLPLSLAAALILGIGIGRGPWLSQHRTEPVLHLTMPTGIAARGSTDAQPPTFIPVEEADPAAWYRYIQELLFSGQTQLAEEHLHRFRELHPDFVYQP